MSNHYESYRIDKLLAYRTSKPQPQTPLKENDLKVSTKELEGADFNKAYLHYLKETSETSKIPEPQTDIKALDMEMQMSKVMYEEYMRLHDQLLENYKEFMQMQS